MTKNVKPAAGKPPRAVAVRIVKRGDDVRRGNPSLGISSHLNFAMTDADEKHLAALEKADKKQNAGAKPLKRTQLIRAALRMAAKGEANTRESES